MVHNGIEYGDMQLISEAYDVLKVVGGLSNAELEAVFTQWNKVGMGAGMGWIWRKMMLAQREAGGCAVERCRGTNLQDMLGAGGHKSADEF
jgi:6-phosphogluconate dehydrogenase